MCFLIHLCRQSDPSPTVSQHLLNGNGLVNEAEHLFDDHVGKNPVVHIRKAT